MTSDRARLAVSAYFQSLSYSRVEYLYNHLKRIAVKLCEDIHDFQRMNPIDFTVPLTDFSSNTNMKVTFVIFSEMSFIRWIDIFCYTHSYPILRINCDNCDSLILCLMLITKF